MKTRLILLTTLLAIAMAVVGQNTFADKLKKAEAGDAGAQVDVGYAYQKGEGISKEPKSTTWRPFRVSDDMNGNRFSGSDLYVYTPK